MTLNQIHSKFKNQYSVIITLQLSHIKIQNKFIDLFRSKSIMKSTTSTMSTIPHFNFNQHSNLHKNKQPCKKI